MPRPLEMLFEFHQKAASRVPNGEAGVAAIQRIRELLGPDWNYTYEPGNYLKHRMWTTNQPAHDWLHHFARKLEVLSTIPGCLDVFRRLGYRASFWSAWSELDFALKLHLGGFACQFIPVSDNERTPDISAIRNEVDLTVEVTSIDPLSSRGLALGAAQTIEWTAFQHKCAARGHVRLVSSLKQIATIELKIQEACKEANETRRPVRVNIRGLMTYFVAPWDLVSKNPERWRSRSTVTGVREPSLAEQVARAVRKKSVAQLRNAKIGLIAIYDQLYLMDAYGRERKRLDSKETLEIGELLSTFPNILAAIFVRPYVSVLELAPKIRINEEVSLIDHSLRDFEGESLLMLRNPLAEKWLFQYIEECLDKFPDTLQALYK